PLAAFHSVSRQRIVPTGSCEEQSTRTPLGRCGNAARTWARTKSTSARSWSSTGVSNVIQTTSALPTASARSVVGRSRPVRTSWRTSDSSPGSATGGMPAASRATASGFGSQAVTAWPAADTQAAVTEPRCHNPSTATFMALRSRTAEDCQYGPGENLQIEPQRPIFDVLEVQQYPVIEIGDAIATTHLPETGDARAYAQLPLLPVLVATELMGEGGPRPDQAHVALHDTPKLRQLVQAVLAKKPAQRSDARVSLHLEDGPGHLFEMRYPPLAFAGIRDHRRELVADDLAPLEAHAPPPIQDRKPRRGGLDRNGDQQEQRGEQHQGSCRH